MALRFVSLGCLVTVLSVAYACSLNPQPTVPADEDGRGDTGPATSNTNASSATTGGVQVSTTGGAPINGGGGGSGGTSGATDQPSNEGVAGRGAGGEGGAPDE